VFAVPPGQVRDGDLWSNDTPLHEVARAVCSVSGSSALRPGARVARHAPGGSQDNVASRAEARM
jgi:hypothetical protein